MKNSYFRAIAFVVLSLSFLACPRGTSANEIIPRDSICGARCVKLILELMGETCDLLSIANEIHDGQLSRPASLASIRTFMNKRQSGWDACHSENPKIFLQEKIVSDFSPRILHMSDFEGMRDHYIVYLGTSDGMCWIWDGSFGQQWISVDRIASGMSGYVLLRHSEREGEDPVIWIIVASITFFGGALVLLLIQEKRFFSWLTVATVTVGSDFSLLKGKS